MYLQVCLWIRSRSAFYIVHRGKNFFKNFVFLVEARHARHRSECFVAAISVPQTEMHTKTQRKKLAQLRTSFRLKSGDYLSSRRLTASTFGVKELNFCVRNGNRWILFAIITAMVIYSASAVYIRFFSFLGLSYLSELSPLPKIYNYIANLYEIKSLHILLEARRNYRFFFINVKIS